MAGTPAKSTTDIGRFLDQRIKATRLYHSQLADRLVDKYQDVHKKRLARSYVAKLLIAWRTGRMAVQREWYKPIALAVSEDAQTFYEQHIRELCMKSRGALAASLVGMPVSRLSQHTLIFPEETLTADYVKTYAIEGIRT
jgi:hypothetical protein